MGPINIVESHYCQRVSYVAHSSLYLVQFYLSCSSVFQAFSWGFHSVRVCEPRWRTLGTGHAKRMWWLKLWPFGLREDLSLRPPEKKISKASINTLTKVEKHNRFAAFQLKWFKNTVSTARVTRLCKCPFKDSPVGSGDYSGHVSMCSLF